uniref:Uncharacterized protein n=1 Tax=Mustela putorius furo TaxID=9669 RepID=M3XTL1_MUSPF
MSSGPGKTLWEGALQRALGLLSGPLPSPRTTGTGSQTPHLHRGQPPASQTEGPLLGRGLEGLEEKEEKQQKQNPWESRSEGPRKPPRNARKGRVPSATN